MDDTRLSQITALIDDSRCLAAELCDELPTTREERFMLTSLRQHLNNALRVTQQIQDGQ